MKKVKKFQQGDVIVKMIDKIPEEAQKVKATNRGYVLAEGEATGHAHTLEALPTTQLFNNNGLLFLSLLSPQKIRHEEHREITLPSGNFQIGIVREVDPFSEETKKVTD